MKSRVTLLQGRKGSLVGRGLKSGSGQGAVSWIECSTLEIEYMSSNPSNGELVCPVCFFLLLPSSSLSSPTFYSVSGVSSVVPLWGATLLWDQLPAIEKSYIYKLVTAQGDLFEKILAAPKNTYISAMFGAKKYESGFESDWKIWIVLFSLCTQSIKFY